jgi:uncharacterized protein YbjT (DUF2867 family)
VIAVTGATGRVGRLVAEELARRGEPVRLLVRDPARAPRLDGAEVVRADFGDPVSLAAALREGDRVFMVSLTEAPERRMALHRSFVDACVAAGVDRVVYLSFAGAGPDATFMHARSHGATEELLADSGLRWTAIRNGLYADELPEWFDADGVAREACGDGRLTFSYRPELARAIAAVLVEPRHDRARYGVYTPPPVTLAELAALASEVTGRPFRYEPAARALWDARWEAAGRPGWRRDGSWTSYEAIALGELEAVSDDYRLLTGEDPLTVRELLERMADELPNG